MCQKKITIALMRCIIGIALAGVFASCGDGPSTAILYVKNAYDGPITVSIYYLEPYNDPHWVNSQFRHKPERPLHERILPANALEEFVVDKHEETNNHANENYYEVSFFLNSNPAINGQKIADVTNRAPVVIFFEE